MNHASSVLVLLLVRFLLLLFERVPCTMKYEKYIKGAGRLKHFESHSMRLLFIVSRSIKKFDVTTLSQFPAVAEWYHS